MASGCRPNCTDSTFGTAAYYLQHGVAADKIVLGIPFYANQYVGVATGQPERHGLYQPFDDSPLDGNSLAWDVTNHPTYHDLVDNAGLLAPNGTPVAGTGWAQHTDPLAGEQWLWNPTAVHPDLAGLTTPTFISYTTPQSVAERRLAIQALHLRGAMAWEISQDSNSSALLGQLSPLLGH